MDLGIKKRQIISRMTYWLGFLLLPLLVLPTQADPSWVAKIQKLIAQPAYQKTRFSIHVYHLQLRQSLFSHHANQPFIPASNMKLITTATALDLLGPDFQYETVFALHRDDLVVLASGDPLTGDPVLAKRKGESILEIFHQVAAQLKQRNRQVILGHLVIDATVFDDQRFHPSWPLAQADKWYTAQIDALNFNNNCLDKKTVLILWFAKTAAFPERADLRGGQAVSIGLKGRMVVHINKNRSETARRQAVGGTEAGTIVDSKLIG